jgi:PadR family transcriptional regulator, regulatory protein PadR
MKNSNQLLRGSLSTIVLKLLTEQEKMYGYEITRKVKELSEGGLSLTEGALYPTLHRLEADGLLEVSVEQISNRPRKYYTLTKGGKKEAKKKMMEWQQYVQQLQLILNIPLALKP